METARFILRWLDERWRSASSAARILYLLVLAGVFVLIITTLSTTTLWSLFHAAHPVAQFAIFATALIFVLATSIFAWERGDRAEKLKLENENLREERTKLLADLSSKDKDIQQLEARWEKLCDVEANEALWSRPVACTPPRFVPLAERKTRFLSVINLKGGVGKTTIAGSLAASLALSEKPCRVLLVDIDFQGTLGDSVVDPRLLALQTKNASTSVRLLSDSQIDLKSLQLPMHNVPGCSVIVSIDRLEREDYRLQARFFVDDSHEPRFRFRGHLHTDPVLQQFDVVIFDCPPRLTTSSVNALTCSDFVLIPTKAKQVRFMSSTAKMTGACIILLIASSSGCAPSVYSPADVARLDSKTCFPSGKVSQLVNAAEEGDTKVIDALIKEGVDINYVGAYGVTPLFRALIAKNKEGYRSLLAHGADPNIRHSKGLAVMHEASQMPDPYWLRLAIQNGGDPNLPDTGNPYTKDKTPLFYAISGRRPRNVELLINAGANANYTEPKEGLFPLYVAYNRIDNEIVYLLLKAGADFRQKRVANEDNLMEWVDKRTKGDFDGDQAIWFEKTRELLSTLR